MNPLRERVLDDNGNYSFIGTKKAEPANVSGLQSEMMKMRQKIRSLEESGDKDVNKKLIEADEKLRQIRGINQTLSEKMRPLELSLEKAEAERLAMENRLTVALREAQGLRVEKERLEKEAKEAKEPKAPKKVAAPVKAPEPLKEIKDPNKVTLKEHSEDKSF